MFLLNRWVVNFGSGVFSVVAWHLAKNDNLVLFIIVISLIIIWNYSDGLFKNPNK